MLGTSNIHDPPYRYASAAQGYEDNPVSNGRLTEELPLFYEYRRHDSEDLYKSCDTSIAVGSISLLVINLLNRAHNEFADESGMIKGLKTLGIEVGLLASSMILAPIEAITRLAIGIILSIPAFIANGILGQNNFSDVVFGGLGLGSLLCGLSIAHGAVSLFTNVAYSDKEIDYIGQAEKYIHFNEPVRSQNLEQTTTEASREQRASRFLSEREDFVFVKIPGQFRSIEEIRQDKNFTKAEAQLIRDMQAMVGVKHQQGYSKNHIDQMLLNPEWSALQREIITNFRERF